MIPPEPEPVTPAEYTYSTSASITLDSITGTIYKDIQFNGSACEVTTTTASNTYHYKHLILYNDALGDPQCYFVRGTSSYVGILGNNAEIGLTINTYVINNGTVTQGNSEYLDSSTPSDYFENVRTRNFTLTQR